MCPTDHTGNTVLLSFCMASLLKAPERSSLEGTPGSSLDTPGSSLDTPGSSLDTPGSSLDTPGSSSAVVHTLYDPGTSWASVHLLLLPSAAF